MLRGLVLRPEAGFMSVLRDEKRVPKHRVWRLPDFIRPLLASPSTHRQVLPADPFQKSADMPNGPAECAGPFIAYIETVWRVQASPSAIAAA